MVAFLLHCRIQPEAAIIKLDFITSFSYKIYNYDNSPRKNRKCFNFVKGNLYIRTNRGIEFRCGGRN